jgi:transposase-like protein
MDRLVAETYEPGAAIRAVAARHGVCESLLFARAETAAALAQCSSDQALIAHLKLEIAKLNRDRFGPRSERTARLLDQMELQLEELEASATEDELAAEIAAARTSQVAAFTRTPRPAGHSPRTCRASGSSCPALPPVRAAAVRAWPSSERTSPRRWK